MAKKQSKNKGKKGNSRNTMLTIIHDSTTKKDKNRK